MTPGQIAYTAWMKWLTEGKLGTVERDWDYLSPRYREGWESAAQAVVDRGFELREETRMTKMTRDEIHANLRELVAEALKQYDAGMAVDVEAEYDALADKLWEQTR